MFKGQSQITQEVTTIKTPHENLIEFLETRGLKHKADNLSKDDKSLDLSENNIGEAGATELARVLKDNSTLTSLYLSSNKIGSILRRINKYLVRNKDLAEKKAESLNAAGDDLYNQEKYSEAIEKYKAAIKLISYDQDKLELYEKNQKKAEKKYEEQKKQILSENDELAEIVNKFFHDPTAVSLCYQIITDDFAKLVADKLKVIKTITAIDFMGSTISDQSIKIITEALKTSTQLKKLDFSGCDLGDQKISILAEVLQLKTLTHLCLNANYIGTVGINAIIEALKENTTITHIDLKQNNIDQQSQIIIEKYLQRNKNLLEEHNSFQKLVDKLNDKIANDANIKNKSIVEDTIKYIIQKTPLLTRTIDRDQIITDIQKLLDNKFAASKFMGIKEELEELIEQQSINDDTNVLGIDSTFG